MAQLTNIFLSTRCIKKQLPIILILIIFSIYAILVFNLNTFEFDNDEGLNLIKADLYLKGFSLYQDIWNDQPPLFTILLATLFKVAGSSVESARILVLGFSLLLLWCFYQIIELSLGWRSATVATILLSTSWMFARLSISVMIGIPSLALAMLSIYLFILSRKRESALLLFFSGICFTLSLQTKLFTVFLVPLFFLLCLEKKNGRTNIFHNQFNYFFIWLFTVIFLYFLTNIILGVTDYNQLVFSHSSGASTQALKSFGSFRGILKRLLYSDFLAVFLVSLGLFVITTRRIPSGIFPLAWLLIGGILLLRHSPVWYHHYLLLSVPVCWLAAYGVFFLFESLRNARKTVSPYYLFSDSKVYLILLVALLVLVSLIRFPAKIAITKELQGFIPPPFQPPQTVIENLINYRSSTRWIFTDKPILAFETGLSIPPEIAVLSRKRVLSGNLSQDYLLNILKKYEPEQIVIARYIDEIKNNDNLYGYIKSNYKQDYSLSNNYLEYYLRNGTQHKKPI